MTPNEVRTSSETFAREATIPQRWRCDLERYPERSWLREPSLYAVALLRLGQSLDERQPRGYRLLNQLYWLAFRFLEVSLGISIPKQVHVGEGLRFYHFGGIFVNEASSIGSNCTLRQGVTIGSRRDGEPGPTIANGVDIGAYAQVLGDIAVGDNAKIGAGAIVLTDVPPNVSVVGNPARAVSQ
jgi:serine O-acetyltransferase